MAISYDSPETLKQFTASRGITFPLISDPGSAIIKRYGLLNDTVDPKSSSYGIPHPGTFIVNRQGVVQSRFFEDAYQERYTAATILSTLGRSGGSQAVSADTPHLSMTASLSNNVAAPGERLALTINVTPKRGMHLYAPEIYYFKPLDERVEVFMKPFRLRRDFTLMATPEAQKQLAALTSVTISGALEYQACDDTLCFNPAHVPFSFALPLKGLERRPPGGADSADWK